MRGSEGERKKNRKVKSKVTGGERNGGGPHNRHHAGLDNRGLEGTGEGGSLGERD